ncbi:MAG: hypothetical protein UY64_C0045G0012 [Parcubacteria group bacterium GW2011_GWA1_51_12]|nr:MAG: hypothetical protein UY64_C0045G0012 [Parcubacteria group bacterium GW2011_GWA1_51_12]
MRIGPLAVSTIIIRAAAFVKQELRPAGDVFVLEQVF